MPDRLFTVGGLGMVRTGKELALGGGGELAYWSRFEDSFVYGGVDVGATDRVGYAEIQLAREFGEWPRRQIIVGAGVGPGVRWRTDGAGERPISGQLTIWSSFRFKPSNIPSPIFPFVRVEVSAGGTSLQGGLMLKVGTWR